MRLFRCVVPGRGDPADLLRSYLLMLAPSITQWVQQLQRCPLYAVLGGFEYGHTPGVGTFYGFFRRLWAAETVNPPALPPKGERGQCRAESPDQRSEQNCPAAGAAG